VAIQLRRVEAKEPYRLGIIKNNPDLSKEAKNKILYY